MALTPTRRGFLRTMGATVAAGVAGCAAPSPAPDRADLDRTPAALFRGDLQRRGDHTALTSPDRVEHDWRLGGINTGDHTAAKASFVEAPNGLLVVPGDTGTVTAVDAAGEVRWRAETEPATRGIHGTPAIANRTVYVGAYDGALYAFDLETGERRWRTKLGDAIGSSPAYHDGRLFVPVEFYQPSGSLFVVDAADGAVELEDPWPTNHPHSTPAIDRESGKLVFGSNDGFLYVWDYPSLERAWRFETGGPIKGPIATHDGAAFFGSWDASVYRVDLETGAEDWSFETGGKVMAAPAVDPDEGTVYIGSHDSGVYALDADGGTERWRFDTGGIVLGGVAVTADHVLAGSYDRHLYAADRATGEVVWRHASTGWVTSAPLVTDAGVFYTDRATDERAGGGYRLVGPV